MGASSETGLPRDMGKEETQHLGTLADTYFVPKLPGFLAPSLRLSGLVAATVVLLLLVPPPTAAEHAPIFYIPPALNHLFHVNIPTKNQFGKSITV